uniref:hypothetical protein n=1 Tax=Candidatus Electrothrix sp. TaxID=2170559 RepID=UPI004057297E
YAAYNTTFTIINNAGSNTRYSERARITLVRFTEDMEAFYFGNSGVLQGEKKYWGEFRGDSLSFTSTAHLRFNKDDMPAGYTLITYSVEESAQSDFLQLYRKDAPLVPGAKVDEDTKGFLLCKGLREVAFSYIDADGVEHDSWDTEDKEMDQDAVMPLRVRLKIGFAQEEGENETIYFSTGVAFRQTQ